jgi:hypothetical protein
MWVPGDAKEEARVPSSWARQPLLLVLMPLDRPRNRSLKVNPSRDCRCYSKTWLPALSPFARLESGLHWPLVSLVRVRRMCRKTAIPQARASISTDLVC